LLVVAFAPTLGCNRSYYRRQADADAQRLIVEKANNPHWQAPPVSIKIDPRSRMEDVFSADHPPLPPDDPASHLLMEEVDGKPGYPHWHANGDTNYVENPEWQSFLPVNEDGVVVLDMDRAFRLALINSREYQLQKEELYLSALDVSLERFSFETQFFVPFGGSIETTGARRTGDSSTIAQAGTTGVGNRMQKAGIAGSQLVVNLANSLMWQLSGPDSNAINSSLGFELVQPLLRGAGRDRILASLTDSERQLLGNVRQMERFRRGFYLQITAGTNSGSGIQRSGGFLGVSQGGSTGGAGGVLGLLQTQQNIRIQEANVASQRSIIKLFEEFAAANRISLLQLQQFRTSLYNAQSQLIQSKADYQTSLDSFKILLGLPPEVEIRIEDPLLDEFILINDEILNRQNELVALQESVGEVIVGVIQDEDFINADIDEASTFAMDEKLTADLQKLDEALAATELMLQQIYNHDIPKSKSDIQNFHTHFSERIESLQRLQQKISNLNSDDESDTPVMESNILSRDTLDETSRALEQSLNSLMKRIESFSEALKKERQALQQLKTEANDRTGKELKLALKELAFDPIPRLLTELSSIIGEISLLQARARNDSLLLENIDISAEQAIEFARVYRRDWMNARASLVDTWRDIEFFADDLESQLDLTFAGDMGTVGNNPLDFRTSTGRLQVGFRFDAPITRMSERNSYRNALISYQRARRSYMLYKDQIAQQLRLIVRNIEVNKLNFEIRRQAIKVAVQQLELAQFQLEEPPQPGQASSRLGSTTARDLTDALNNLQGAQNALIAIYVNYEVLRRNLDFQMGTMQLDADGFWIDPGEITVETGFQIPIPYSELPRRIDFPSDLPVASPKAGSDTGPFDPRQNVLPLPPADN
jgi:hypothetical protein